MTTAMQSIKDMVDVNTIVGDAVQSPDGTVIIPISRVAFGFGAGGSEFSGHIEDNQQEEENGGDKESETGRFPFGGGSGAGVSIVPIAFLVVSKENIKLLPVSYNTSLEKVLDFIPEALERLTDAVKKKIAIKKETKSGEDLKKKEILTEK